MIGKVIEMDRQPLSAEMAGAIYDVLVGECKAPARSREHFIHAQTRRHETEWRFMGSLGFGGKFWRTTGRRSDGSWGECWYVNQYPEDATADSRGVIHAANAKLSALLDGLDVQS